MESALMLGFDVRLKAKNTSRPCGTPKVPKYTAAAFKYKSVETVIRLPRVEKTCLTRDVVERGFTKRYA
jgi:hypothetical protein